MNFFHKRKCWRERNKWKSFGTIFGEQRVCGTFQLNWLIFCRVVRAMRGLALSWWNGALYRYSPFADIFSLTWSWDGTFVHRKHEYGCLKSVPIPPLTDNAEHIASNSRNIFFGFKNVSAFGKGRLSFSLYCLDALCYISFSLPVNKLSKNYSTRSERAGKCTY